MKGYVITIESMPESVRSAEKCISSAARYGFEVEKFTATTPADVPEEFLKSKGIPTDNFKEVYSRYESCIAAFSSHYRLWEKGVTEKERLVVLEHDAYFVDEVPKIPFNGVLSLGKPSYGKYNKPKTLGVNKLTSKQYLPGAHAYMISPDAAKILIERAKDVAAPTDLYICNQNFQFVHEFYPWPVEARDTFTSIQSEAGCIAKHSYQKNADKYKIL